VRGSGKHDNEISDYEEDGSFVECHSDCMSSRRTLFLEDWHCGLLFTWRCR